MCKDDQTPRGAAQRALDTITEIEQLRRKGALITSYSNGRQDTCTSLFAHLTGYHLSANLDNSLRHAQLLIGAMPVENLAVLAHRSGEYEKIQAANAELVQQLRHRTAMIEVYQDQLKETQTATSTARLYALGESQKLAAAVDLLRNRWTWRDPLRRRQARRREAFLTVYSVGRIERRTSDGR